MLALGKHDGVILPLRRHNGVILSLRGILVLS